MGECFLLGSGAGGEGTIDINLEGTYTNEGLKPQSPLQKEGEYFYPLTAVDQVIMEDGRRLNVALEEKQSKITGTVGDFVIIGADGNLTTKTLLNAEEASF